MSHFYFFAAAGATAPLGDAALCDPALAPVPAVALSPGPDADPALDAGPAPALLGAGPAPVAAPALLLGPGPAPVAAPAFGAAPVPASTLPEGVLTEVAGAIETGLAASPPKMIGKPLGEEPKITTFELLDSANLSVASIPLIFK